MKNILLSLLAVLLSAPVYADGGGRHGGSGHRGSWGWEGGWFFPALVGGAIFLDLARSRTTYVQPETVYVQPEPVYMPSTAAAPVWYFCPAANAYYPYVNSCPSGWQTVPATPPAAPVFSNVEKSTTE
jgi:hypothetical protein